MIIWIASYPKSGNWKNELDIKISSQIEQIFKEEMKELGYL